MQGAHIVEAAAGWRLAVEVSERGVTRVWFALDGVPARVEHPLVRETARQLGLYFLGELREFDLPLDLRGTAFQTRVWEELRRIPYGQTRTYGEMTRLVGASPAAARALGQANGANPIAIIVPCHRVVASGGGLGGYSAGLDYKRRLLSLESMNRISSSSLFTSTPISSA